jgi:lysophospholipase L1-like esterase
MRKFFLLSIGILIILTGCEGSKKSSPQQRDTTPGRQDSNGTTVIAAIGDSITWGAMAFGERAPSGGYPAILEAKLRAAGYDVVVLNKGIPGEKSFETDTRFLKVIEGADIVLILIGTNDILRPEGCPEPRHCRTVEHIAAMVEKALTANIVPLVSTVTPAQTGCNRNWANPHIQALNTQIYEMARARNVTIVDNHQAILDHGGGTLFADCVHFQDRGYEVIAQQWYNALVQNNLIKNDQTTLPMIPTPKFRDSGKNSKG